MERGSRPANKTKRAVGELPSGQHRLEVSLSFSSTQKRTPPFSWAELMLRSSMLTNQKKSTLPAASLQQRSCTTRYS